MGDHLYNVLFLCTGNSARSVIAECVLNRVGQGRFTSFSAGSQPTGKVNPYALAMLKEQNYDVTNLRSKSWDEFAGEDGPKFDFIFTVCDNAPREACPVWPGRPLTAHWGLPDPAAIQGSQADKARAFADCLAVLTQRIEQFCSLPLNALDQATLAARLEAIGARDQGPA